MDLSAHPVGVPQLDGDAVLLALLDVVAQLVDLPLLVSRGELAIAFPLGVDPIASNGLLDGVEVLVAETQQRG